MKNEAVAAVFEEIAVILEIQGANSFKIRSYAKAAESIRELGRDIEKDVGDGAG